MLHERRPGRRGPGPRPARARGGPRGGATGRGRRDRLRRGDVPARSRRCAGQRPGPPRAPRPRDPHLPSGRRPRDGPRDDLPWRPRREPHRPSRRGHGGGRRGLPGGAQPDGVPVARTRRPRGAPGPAAVPLLVEPPRCLDRRDRDAGPQARGAPRPRQPDRRLRGADRTRAHPGCRGRRADRGHGGRGLPAHRDRRGRSGGRRGSAKRSRNGPRPPRSVSAPRGAAAGSGPTRSTRRPARRRADRASSRAPRA